MQNSGTLLDTSVLIEILGGNIAAIEKVSKIGERAATTVITKHELL